MPDSAENQPLASAESVRGQLARILASPQFVSSQRLCRFLRFLVERTLEHDTDRLKEFVVAMEVFDRNEDYDPNIDSIVRVEARRLRNKLKSYYETGGQTDAVQIELRPGSYVPSFRMSGMAVEGPASDSGASRATTTTVAVLPFVNMSPEPEQEYFCDGMTEEILNALASIEGLAVVARTSSFQFKGKSMDVREIGEKLNAQVVVEGSVRKAGEQLRITAQAIDAARGVHLWSETYSRDLKDVFAVQEELATAVARTLRGKLPIRQRYQPEPRAYLDFLRGMFLLRQQNVGSLRAALDLLGNLTSRYPEYAAPHAGIAGAYGLLCVYGAVAGAEVFPEMRRHAERALQLDPDLGEAWSVNGGLAAHWDYDWARGEQCFQRAIALMPGNPAPRGWYGMMLLVLGRFKEAEVELSRSTQLNPLAPSDHTRKGLLHYLRGEEPAAEAEFNRAFFLETDFAEARLYAALLRIRQERFADAVDLLSRHLDRLPLATHIGLLGLAYGRWGKVEAARECLARLDAVAASPGYVTPLAKAWIHLGLGETDKAIEGLDLAITDRTIFVQFVNLDPLYEPLRGDRRFHSLINRLRL
jgi:serine/threonine-protein kinase